MTARAPSIRRWCRGFGLVERRGSRRFRFLSTGTISTAPHTPDPGRLVVLHRDMRELLEFPPPRPPRTKSPLGPEER